MVCEPAGGPHPELDVGDLVGVEIGQQVAFGGVQEPAQPFQPFHHGELLVIGNERHVGAGGLRQRLGDLVEPNTIEHVFTLNGTCDSQLRRNDARPPE